MGDAVALVTGTLYGMLQKYSEDPQRPVRIDKVENERDEHGDRKSILTLTMKSGKVVRIIVAEVDP